MAVMLSISLTGCWNYREIDQLYMVSGFAVDKSPDGRYLITAETVDIKSGDKEATFASKTFSAEGATILDAIRNIVIISGRKLYFSHAKVAVISQDVAIEGIIQILDLIIRDTEPRLELNVMISKEKTAKELFITKNESTKIQGLEIDKMVKSQISLSKAPTTKVYELINSLSTENESAVLPAVGFDMNAGIKDIALSGAALIKKDKFVGFLDKEDTKHILFVKNQVKKGVLPEIESNEASHSSISLEIFESKTKITPVYSSGKTSINVNIKTNAIVDEHGPVKSYIDKESISILKREAEKALEKNIKDTIHKVQEQYEVDIFGFGNEIKRKMPALWKSIAQDWDNLFKDLDVDVKASIDIRGSGQISRPIKIGE